MDGSSTTIPRRLAKTRVLAVPRSIARSDENRLESGLKFTKPPPEDVYFQLC
jgi:hypothetical protein